MAYQFFIGVLPLPITPGALTIKTPSMNQTINLANEGEINIPKNRGLHEISFDFLLPQLQKYPFTEHTVLKGGFDLSISSPYIDKAIGYAQDALMSGLGTVMGAVNSGAHWVAGAVSDAVSPASMSRRGIGAELGGNVGGTAWSGSIGSDGSYGAGLSNAFGSIGFSYTPDMELNAANVIQLLESWKETKLPIQFIVCRTSPAGKYLFDTNIKCLIEDFTTEEDAEEYGMDVMCSITLKEYRDYGTKSVKLKETLNKDGSTTKTASQTNTRSTSGKSVPSSTKAQEGDTLANIAKKATGTFDSVSDFATENGIADPLSEYSTDSPLSGNVSEITDSMLQLEESGVGIPDVCIGDISPLDVPTGDSSSEFSSIYESMKTDEVKTRDPHRYDNFESVKQLDDAKSACGFIEPMSTIQTPPHFTTGKQHMNAGLIK